MSNDPRRFLVTLASILEVDVNRLRAMSVQDLDELCRRRGRPVERVVRQSESAIQCGQKLRHGNLEDSGDGRQVLDRPSRPPPEPHRERGLGDPKLLRQGFLLDVTTSHPRPDFSGHQEGQLFDLISAHPPRIGLKGRHRLYPRAQGFVSVIHNVTPRLEP